MHIQAIGPSMLPTIRNEFVIVDMLSYNLLKKPCKKGDIVLITSPRNKDEIACKRVAATAGDVVFREESGKKVEIVIPPNHIWVLGDNPSESYDSRYYGYIHVENVRGRVWLRLSPLELIK
jgi:signal peptidase I